MAGDDIQLILNMSLSELEALSPVAMDMIRWLYGALGNLKVSWSFFVIAITLTGYRKGEKWAWYTLWLAPILLVTSGIYNSYFIGDIGPLLQFMPVTAISLAGLFLPYRKFFPRTPSSGSG